MALSNKYKKILRSKLDKTKVKVKVKTKSKSKSKSKSATDTAPVEFKAGKAVNYTENNNCLSCMHWKKCPSKKKGFKHACTKLKLYPVKSNAASNRGVSKPMMFTSTGAKDPDEGLTKEERVISDLISRTVKGSGVIAADARINDQDLPTAPNFYTWVTDPKYMGTLQVPWAKQIEHPTKLLSEWCPNPKCTDTKWFENTPVDATPGDFYRVTFLEHGVCPKCRIRKSEWIARGLLNPYNALAGLAGQRAAKCVAVSHTIPVHGQGLLRMGELLKHNKHKEQGTFKTVKGLKFYGRHNELKEVSHTYNSGKQKCLAIETSVGEMFTSVEHPLYVVGQGFVKANELKIGDKVHVVVNQQAFGTKSIGRARASALGWFVAEGSIDYNTKTGLPNGASLSQREESSAKHIAALFTKAGFGVRRIAPPTDSDHNTYSLELDSDSGRELHKILYYVGAVTTAKDWQRNKVRSANICVPKEIRTAPKSEVVAFLRAMFSGDGCVTKDKYTVGYTTVSRQLARDLCDMLMNLGVVPLLHKKACPGKLATTSIAYAITIAGEMTHRFNEVIGFDCADKQAKLEAICERTRSKSHVKHAHYATTLGQFISQVNTSERNEPNRPVSKPMIARIVGGATGVIPEELLYAVEPDVHVAEIRSISKFGKLKLGDVTVPSDHEFICGGLINHNTATAVMIIGYDLHRLLKSQNPSAMYGVMSSQMLTGTFAALTFDQAKDNVWSNMYNMLTDAPWFQTYHAFLKDECYRLGIEDAYDIKNTYAKYRHRNLFYHVSGPNKRTMRGKTRVTAMIDEIGWFIQQLKAKSGSEPERLDAKGTHVALDRSLATVRIAAESLLLSGRNENVSMGYMYETSSPSAKTDMIMQLYEKSRGSRTTYGYRMATWEGNPNITRDSAIIVEAYREDHIAAHRDYAAVPPVSGSPFVKLPSLRNLFSNKRENGGLLKTIQVVNLAGQTQTSGEIKKLRAHKGHTSMLSVDAGSVNNSFALTVLYVNDEGKVICPFIGEIFPSPEAPIHFPDVVNNICGKLIEHFNCGLVAADRWQSIMFLQTLAEEHGIAAVTRSVKYPDFDHFRQSAIYDGGLQLPMLENKPKDAIKLSGNPGYPGVYNKQPVSHLLYQLVAVNDIVNVTVTKPDGGTDDLFRSLVLGYTCITDPEYAMYFEQEERQKPGYLGIMVNGQTNVPATSLVTNVGVVLGAGSSIGGGSSSMGVLARK